MIETAPTIPMALAERVRMTPGAVAYRDATIGSAWRDISWSELAQRVTRRRAALAMAKLKPGDRVAIFLSNGIEWVITDLAAMAQGLVTVPLYVRDSALRNGRSTPMERA
ncbi:AMP-binding protein [Lutimaribacter marinistellae]|uniref:AMP-binding protein n=1 Tax=Lutimaribacter marinistellae TaxID=1820329 RepID=A0ABV7THX1_9RHOB